MSKANWNERIKVGQKFGRLVVAELPKVLNQCAKIYCICDCGKEVQPRLGNLLSGNTKSCGCRTKEAHVATIKKALAARWANSIFQGDTANEYAKIADRFQTMHDRVNGKYESRGITVCPEWSRSETGYQNFKQWFLSELDRINVSLKDFNNMPNDRRLTVDRIDNDGNYSPDNCRVANYKQQNRNRGNSCKYLDKHILDYADELGFSYRKAYRSYCSGTFAKLLSQYGEINHE